MGKDYIIPASQAPIISSVGNLRHLSGNLVFELPADKLCTKGGVSYAYTILVGLRQSKYSYALPSANFRN